MLHASCLLHHKIMTYYLFGVTDDTSPAQYGTIGFADPYGDRADVKAIHYGGISMVACELDEWMLDEADKHDLLTKLLDHQKITEQLMKRRFILPVKFGTTVEDERAVISILSRYHAELKNGIEEMKDFVEVDVVATWDPIAEVKKIGETDDEIKKMKAKIQKLGPDKMGEAMMMIGKMLQEKLEEKRIKVEKLIANSLKSHFVKDSSHERFEDRMIINNSYLLKSGSESAFFEALDKADAKMESSVMFKCIHPLPPHSFATVHVAKVDPHELKDAIDLFEVTPNSTVEEIKNKNRELTKKFHPDKAGKGSSDKFEKLNKGGKLLLRLLTNSSPSEIDLKRCYLLEVQRNG